MFSKSSLQKAEHLRTIRQQMQPARCLIPKKKDSIEMTELKETLTRNAGTLAQDFAGVAALVVIFFTGLSLPGFF
jgi:hypothetical protein